MPRWVIRMAAIVAVLWLTCARESAAADGEKGTAAELTPEQTVKITQDNDEVYLVEFDPGATPRLWKLIREKNLGDL